MNPDQRQLALMTVAAGTAFSAGIFAGWTVDDLRIGLPPGQDIASAAVLAVLCVAMIVLTWRKK